MVEIDALTRFLTSHSLGVLTTLKRDGRPQLSNIIFGYFDDQVHISVTDTRAKTRNALRDPRVSLHVTDENFGRYLVVEGTAKLTAVTTTADDDAAEALVRTYRAISGEHPDWDEYRSAMIDQQRRVVSFAVDHAYGQGIE